MKIGIFLAAKHLVCFETAGIQLSDTFGKLMCKNSIVFWCHVETAPGDIDVYSVSYIILVTMLTCHKGQLRV